MRRGRGAGLAGDALEQELAPEAAERLGRLVDHRQERRQHREVLDVVEADERHVLGNRQAALAQRLHRADRGHVVDREDRGRQRRRAPAPAGSRGSRRSGRPWCGRRRSSRTGMPGGGERLAVALQPVAPGRGVVGVGEVRDVAVADRDQVLDQPAGAGDAVADDEVAVRRRAASGRAARAESRRAAAGRCCAASASLAGRQQQALDPVRDQVLDVFALEPQVALAVAEEHAVAGAPGRGLGAAHHRREERVDDVGHDQPDGLGLLRHEPAGDAVRHVVERRDRLLDPALGLGVDAGAAVDDPRDGHRRDAGAPADIMQGDGQSALLLANIASLLQYQSNSAATHMA